MYSKKDKRKIVDKICDLIADGESLRDICKPKSLPNRITVIRWLNADDEFATDIARARKLQADALDDEIQQVINDIRAGKLDPHAGRTVIWGLQWRAGKLRPQRYGDKQQVDHGITDKASDLLKQLQSIHPGKVVDG